MGLLDGEQIETLWAVLNAILNGARSMSLSNRDETVDDHFGIWNWHKLLDIGLSNFPSSIILIDVWLCQSKRLSADGGIHWRHMYPTTRDMKHSG